MRASLGQATDRLVTVDVEGPRGRQVLEYRSPDAVWSQPPPNLDFAAVALVHYAATSGQDLILDGDVTRSQLDRLDDFLMIWANWRPKQFRRITVSAEREVDYVPGDRQGAVMSFSGGVDASFALAAHKTGAMGRLTQDIGLGVLVVGWDLKPGDDAALRRARESAARALDAYGVRLAVVSTNWQQDFCDTWFMSFGCAVMSILHTFSATHSAAVFATDRSFREELQIPPYGSHMMVNHLLGHPEFPVVSTGGTHTRAERLAFLKAHPRLLEGLRVCYQADAGGRNCGHCEKCVRTQLEMRAVGVPTAPTFPSPLTLDDIRSTQVHRPQVLMHFRDVLRRLDPADEAYETLREWLGQQRSADDPAKERLRERMTRLRQERDAARDTAAAARRELEALRASSSWRVTEPLRRAADAARRIR